MAKNCCWGRHNPPSPSLPLPPKPACRTNLRTRGVSRNPSQSHGRNPLNKYISLDPSPVAAKLDVATPGEIHNMCGTCQDKSPNRTPPLSLKQAEDIVEVLSNEIGGSVLRPCLVDVTLNTHGRFSLSPGPGSSNEAPIRLPNPNIPIQNRLQVITQIKAIIVSEDEARLTDYLSGGAAQTLIDVVHEVRFCPYIV
jgi:hypothetical protein